jgi:serine/threonine-protein kinase RIO1
VVWFVFIAYPRGVEYRKKNIKRTLIMDIHDLNKIFLDSKMQSDKNKWLTGIGTNAS